MGSGVWVTVRVSVGGCTAQLGDSKCWDYVTGVMQPSAAFCVWDFPTVSTAVVQLHSDFAPLCHFPTVSTAVVQLHSDFGSLSVPNCEQQCL